MKNIAIIPARSGSKGVKDKNIKELKGLPLMAYTINAAKQSNMFDCVFVSTDSEKYAEIAKKYGADAHFLRSNTNASDNAGTWDVVKEVMKKFEKEKRYFDNIMLLQPTSPLRTSEDVINCFKLMEEKKANSIVSVTEMEHSPLWCGVIKDDLSMHGFYDNKKIINIPRQELPSFFRLNGAIYLLKREELCKNNIFQENSYAYIMHNSKSLDVDTEMDFAIAELLLNKELEKIR